MRTHHHFGLNVQVQLLLMTIFFFLLPNAAPYLSLIFDSLLDLGEFRGKSTYIQHPGTAEPFRIAPAEPVAYTNLVKAASAGVSIGVDIGSISQIDYEMKVYLRSTTFQMSRTLTGSTRHFVHRELQNTGRNR